MKRQTISIMLENMNRLKKKDGEYSGDYSGMTVMVKNTVAEDDTSCIPWDEMGVEEDLFPEQNLDYYYQGLPGSFSRNDIN